MSFQFLLDNAILILFAFARIGALVLSSPMLNSNAIPALAKAGLSLALGVICVPHMVKSGYPAPLDSSGFIIALFGEVAIGLTMGLIVQVYFSVFQIAGELFTTQIGFSASNVFDPMGEIEMPIFGQFFNLIGLYLLLSVDWFHQLFFRGLYLSFSSIRPSNFLNNQEFLNDFFLKSLGMIFGYALQIAIPVVMILLVMSVTVGLLAKAAPQLNLLMLGFPVNIMVGFLIIFLVGPSMLNYFFKVMQMGWDFVQRWFMSLGGAI